MSRYLTGAAVVAALFLGAGAASAQSYKAVRDFSYQNPGGVWSYGYGTAGSRETFVAYPGALIDGCLNEDMRTDCFYDQESMVGLNVFGATYVVNAPSSSLVVPNEGLRLHPRSDSQDTMVVFTAPAHGFYKMEGYFQILDNRPTGIAPKIVIGSKDQTRKAFGAKEDVVLTGAANPEKKKGGEKRKFSFTRELSKNQRVQFAVNPAGDWRYDSTGFDVTITPVPAP